MEAMKCTYGACIRFARSKSLLLKKKLILAWLLRAINQSKTKSVTEVNFNLFSKKIVG